MVLQLSIVHEESDERIEVNIDPAATVGDTIQTLNSYWDLDDENQLYYGAKPLSADLKWIKSDIKSGKTLRLRKTSSVKKLPIELWKERINNEVEVLLGEGYNMYIKKSDGEVLLDVELEDISGPILIGKSIGFVFEHQFEIQISREYPFTAPIVSWKSNIFHPNILPPEEGGVVKMEYIERWGFSDDLLSLLSSIEVLLNEPEINNRLDHRICTEAAEEYLKDDV